MSTQKSTYHCEWSASTACGLWAIAVSQHDRASEKKGVGVAVAVGVGVGGLLFEW